MKVKNQKKIIYILLLVEIIVAATVFTAAWFASDYDPVIYSNALNIASTDGITVKITDDATALDSLNLKDVARDNDEFKVLSQVSTADMVNMYKQEVSEGNYEYKAVEDSSDYIEVSFLLLSDDDDTLKNVYINYYTLNLVDGGGNTISPTDESYNYIQDALRMSLLVKPDEGDTVTPTIYKILAFDNNGHRYDNAGYYDSTETFVRHSNVILSTDASFANYNSNYAANFSSTNTDYILTNAVYRAGLSDETELTYRLDGKTYINCFKNQAVEYISRYVGGSTGTNQRTLFNINPGEKRSITMRIWLEGADPRCSVALAGSKVQLNLVFGSKEVTA